MLWLTLAHVNKLGPHVGNIGKDIHLLKINDLQPNCRLFSGTYLPINPLWCWQNIFVDPYELLVYASEIYTFDNRPFGNM